MRDAPCIAPGERTLNREVSVRNCCDASCVGERYQKPVWPTIETVAPPEVPASSPASNQPAGVATSMNNIQLALDGSEPATVKQEKAVAKGAQPVRKSTVASNVSKPADKRSARVADSDAELLAAMLPHLKRIPPAPSSPAYEKRCGQLIGDAAVDCRAKFCKGREGADAACPAALDADAAATSRTGR